MPPRFRGNLNPALFGGVLQRVIEVSGPVAVTCVCAHSRPWASRVCRRERRWRASAHSVYRVVGVAHLLSGGFGHRLTVGESAVPRHLLFAIFDLAAPDVVVAHLA